MRWTRWTPIVSASLAFACAVPLLAAAPAATDAKRIKRGEYLATINGCNDCHTPGSMYGAPDFSRRLGGSDLGWRGPWGVSYPRNLTPDKDTGLGTWSEKDIVDALRTGMRPDGTPLLPPMPWPNYTQMPDEDAYALAAYLKSLPPVRHRVPEVVEPEKAASATGSIVDLPPPPAWDVPPPAGSASK